MITDIYSNPRRAKSGWTRLDAELTGPENSSDLTFVYVGSANTLPAAFRTIFHAGIITHSLDGCLEVFDDLPRSQHPHVIFIDLAIDKLALTRFNSFLSDKKLVSKIVIIYNERRLSYTSINFLKLNRLVDDVINLAIPVDALARKINFLRKVKSGSSKPSRLTGINVVKPLAARNRAFPLKRLIDIIFASVMLIVLTPLLILIAAAILLDSRGPVVYSSLRAGRGFKIFKFYKFRTMVVNADKKIDEYAHMNQYAQAGDSNAKFIKIANDPRITRLGKILRNCSLDELPQLFNVLKGDMSLVGNRPLPLYEASTLTTNDHVERFMAPAGITGLWQIKKRGRAEMSAEERISLDISYARRCNVVYDLWIVAKTPAALFQKSNA